MPTRTSSPWDDLGDAAEALRSAQELVAFLGDSIDPSDPDEGAVVLAVRDDAVAQQMCQLLNDVQQRVAAALERLEGVQVDLAVEVLRRLPRK